MSTGNQSTDTNPPAEAPARKNPPVLSDAVTPSTTSEVTTPEDKLCREAYREMAGGLSLALRGAPPNVPLQDLSIFGAVQPSDTCFTGDRVRLAQVMGQKTASDAKGPIAAAKPVYSLSGSEKRSNYPDGKGIHEVMVGSERVRLENVRQVSITGSGVKAHTRVSTANGQFGYRFEGGQPKFDVPKLTQNDPLSTERIAGVNVGWRQKSATQAGIYEGRLDDGMFRWRGTYFQETTGSSPSGGLTRRIEFQNTNLFDGSGTYGKRMEIPMPDGKKQTADVKSVEYSFDRNNGVWNVTYATKDDRIISQVWSMDGSKVVRSTEQVLPGQPKDYGGDRRNILEGFAQWNKAQGIPNSPQLLAGFYATRPEAERRVAAFAAQAAAEGNEPFDQKFFEGMNRRHWRATALQALEQKNQVKATYAAEMLASFAAGKYDSVPQGGNFAALLNSRTQEHRDLAHNISVVALGLSRMSDERMQMELGLIGNRVRSSGQPMAALQREVKPGDGFLTWYTPALHENGGHPTGDRPLAPGTPTPVLENHTVRQFLDNPAKTRFVLAATGLDHPLHQRGLLFQIQQLETDAVYQQLTGMTRQAWIDKHKDAYKAATGNELRGITFVVGDRLGDSGRRHGEQRADLLTNADDYRFFARYFNSRNHGRPTFKMIYLPETMPPSPRA